MALRGTIGVSWTKCCAVPLRDDHKVDQDSETFELAKHVTRGRYRPPLAIPYLVMHAKGPLGAPVTPRSIVGGATWGLRNGFDVAPRGARAPHARSRARPFPVTARFGHPLLENRFPRYLFGMLSLGEVGGPPTKLPALHPGKVRFLDKSKIWLELRVGIAFAYHSSTIRFLRLMHTIYL